MSNKNLTAILTAMLITGLSAFTTAPVKSSSFSVYAEEITAQSNNADIYSLDNTKHGYGQGKRLDENNRPFGALEFNAEYEKYSAKAIDDTDEKVIYLTFDQGYENGYTAKILDVLKEKGVKATFFVLQDYAQRNPELVRRMIDEGHIVGNHSVTHRSQPTLSVEECKSDIMELHEYMLKNFGYTMTRFRPPCGEFSERSLAVAQECGYETWFWSFAYADWDPEKQPDPAEAVEMLTNAAHCGEILLLHSVSKTNAEILSGVIDNLLAQGYTFK